MLETWKNNVSVGQSGNKEVQSTEKQDGFPGIAVCWGWR